MALSARLYALILAAALLYGLGAGTVYYLMTEKLAVMRADRARLVQAVTEAAKQRDRDQALLTRRAAANAAAARETASLRLRLDAALQARRDWAGQSVPQEVRDALWQ